MIVLKSVALSLTIHQNVECKIKERIKSGGLNPFSFKLFSQNPVPHAYKADI